MTRRFQMSQQQTKLNDFTETEVIEETEKQVTEDETEEVFSPRRRRQLEAAGVPIEAAARVERKLKGAGRWWPEYRTEPDVYVQAIVSDEYIPLTGWLPATWFVRQTRCIGWRIIPTRWSRTTCVH